ncbi:MAG: hypothetical protein KatS3mg014_2184 [Actinomycetota bacterium]|nr:MAG: hypothetical protein KatS3mg014_2184 [Actinomycetota bacterium]
MKRLPLWVGVVLGVVLAPGLALAAWTAAGSGDAFGRAFAMPAGSTPSVSVTGRNVTLSWSGSTFPNGDPVDGYVVRRYPSGGGASQTVLADCAGTVTTTSCVEHAVPAGSWVYTITPVHASWTGTEGATSAAVTIDPPTLTLTPSTVTSLPASPGGTLTGFATGETVTFRLDDPNGGTVLSGSIDPDPVPLDGQATVSVTLPNGTADGAHTVYAVGSAGTQASVAVTVDATPPVVQAAAIQKTQGGSAGYLKQGGTYRVYANVTDAGSSVASVTADVSAITTGQTAVALSAGSWVVDGVTYGYRSAPLTADNPLAEGSLGFAISAADASGHATTQGGFTVTVDNTPPSATDVQTANASGGTVGRAETGDTITFTFSEPIEPGSILAGWDGSVTTVTVRLINNATGDRIQVWNAANGAQLPLGTVVLGRTDYTNASRNFTASTMQMSGSTITVTLGTPSGAVRTAAGTGTMTWTPSTAPYDRAANAMLTIAATEGGPADAEF